MGKKNQEKIRQMFGNTPKQTVCEIKLLNTDLENIQHAFVQCAGPEAVRTMAMVAPAFIQMLEAFEIVDVMHEPVTIKEPNGPDAYAYVTFSDKFMQRITALVGATSSPGPQEIAKKPADKFLHQWIDNDVEKDGTGIKNAELCFRLEDENGKPISLKEDTRDYIFKNITAHIPFRVHRKLRLNGMRIIDFKMTNPIERVFPKPNNEICE